MGFKMGIGSQEQEGRQLVLMDLRGGAAPTWGVSGLTKLLNCPSISCFPVLFCLKD